MILTFRFSEHEVSVFTTFTAQMDTSVKNMLKICSDQTQKYQTHLKREYLTVSNGFQQLGESMQQSDDNGEFLNFLCTDPKMFIY